jgi:hypothetical protein
MVNPLGFNDLKQFALPTGWDASELQKYALVDGTTYEELVNDIAVVLSTTAQMMMNDPFYGGLLYFTEELGLEYRDGTAQGGMKERTEYSVGDPQRGKTIGHMLPLKSFDRGFGWTWDFLRKARRTQIDADIQTGIYDVRENWEKTTLTRFFSDTENQLGSSGFDVPFVKGGGSVAYTPPAQEGQVFTSSHTHFDRKTDDATGWAEALEEGAEHLFEHGILPPYDAIIPYVDKSNFVGLSKFIKPDRGVNYIQAPSANALTTARVDEVYFGMYETEIGLVQLRATRRVPANYAGLYKSYGSNDKRNPLAMRVDPKMGPGPVLMRGDRMREYPLEYAQVIHEFGIGVANRLNGYACFFDAAGSYTAPTIS